MIEVKIRIRMAERDINQAQLAEKTGIRPNTINDLYHDMADRVSLENLEKICVALGCDLFDILVYTPGIKKDRAKRYPNKPK